MVRSLTDLVIPILQHLLRIVLILAAALVLSKIINRWVPSLKKRFVDAMQRHREGRDGELEKRAMTLSAIFSKTATVTLWVIAIVMALREAGFDIGPILAGAGVVGLAIGFGAQNLVRDVISGLFLLMENQIRIGDVVVVNGTGGLVEEINLRTTVLRGEDGSVHIFPNGAIQSLSNMTREYSYYVFALGVAYNEDTDRVIEAMEEVAGELAQEPEFKPLILEPLEVFGVDRFAEASVIVKARIKTLPIRQWAVGREMNRRLKKRFGELGIVLPPPQRIEQVVASAPDKPPTDAQDLGG
jgi:small conductance mechanosensitive channel